MWKLFLKYLYETANQYVAACKQLHDPIKTQHLFTLILLNFLCDIFANYLPAFFRLSQTCNHVAALLFKINAAFKLDLSNPACTSVTNTWASPSTIKGPLNMKLDEMNFRKPSYSKQKGNDFSYKRTICLKIVE